MTDSAGPISAIDVTEAASKVSGSGDDGPLLVDVREDDELVVARVDGAIHVPMSRFAEEYETLPKDRPLYMLCGSGARSAAATGFLKRSGWTDVTNVEGGITAWQRAGLPVKRGPVEPE